MPGGAEPPERVPSADLADASDTDVTPVVGSPNPDDLDPEAAANADRRLDVDASADEASTVWDRRDWIACAVLLVASLLLVGLHVRAYTTLSPIDELQHIDYAIKAGDFDIVRRGETVGDEAMAEAACRSVDAPQYHGPACGLAEYDPADFQESGINTSATQLPPYYVATGLIARAMTGVGIVDSSVTAARLVGALWLASALGLVWYVMALLRVPRLQRGIVSALFMFTPLVLFHASTVNADAILLATGATVLLAAVQFDRGRLSGWWLLLVCAAVFFVEPTNLLPVTAVGAYLSIRYANRTELPWSRRLLPVAIIPVGVLLRLEIVDRLQDALFPRVASMSSAPMFRDRASAEVDVSLDKVLDQLSATFTPVQRAYLPPLLRTSSILAFIFLTNWLLVGLMFASALGPAVRERMALWARVTAVMLLTAGPFYTFYYAYFSNVDFPAPGRFALPLLPILMVVAADGLRTRPAIWFAAALAAGSALTTVGHLLDP